MIINENMASRIMQGMLSNPNFYGDISREAKETGESFSECLVERTIMYAEELQKRIKKDTEEALNDN